MFKAWTTVCAVVFAGFVLVGSLGLVRQPEGSDFEAYPRPSVSEWDVIPSITAPMATYGEVVPTPEITIPMCEPVRIEAPSIGLDAVVYTMTAADINDDGNVSPRYFDAVAYDGDVGSAPGTDSDNTTYLYGHTSYKEAVFNRIKDLKPGDEVLVTTCNGVLHYLVEDHYTVSKPQLTSNARFKTAQPGRMNLVACYRANGDELRTTDNIVVQLQLNQVLG